MYRGLGGAARSAPERRSIAALEGVVQAELRGGSHARANSPRSDPSCERNRRPLGRGRVDGCCPARRVRRAGDAASERAGDRGLGRSHPRGRLQQRRRCGRGAAHARRSGRLRERRGSAPAPPLGRARSRELDQRELTSPTTPTRSRPPARKPPPHTSAKRSSAPRRFDADPRAAPARRRAQALPAVGRADDPGPRRRPRARASSRASRRG